jgi:hypothetical protein
VSKNSNAADDGQEGVFCHALASGNAISQLYEIWAALAMYEAERSIKCRKSSHEMGIAIAIFMHKAAKIRNLQRQKEIMFGEVDLLQVGHVGIRFVSTVVVITNIET